jgi:hypothetical protein
MLEGACLCGAVRWKLEGRIDSATACNCTACRRYGALWAYGHDGEDLWVTGETEAYLRGERLLGFHFCKACGCVTHWRGQRAMPDGRWRAAVNLRLAEPGEVASIPVRRFDGFGTYRDLPEDGRCVADLWF